MRRRIRAECDSGAGFWPVRAVHAVHADRSGGRRRAKGVSSNSRTSALSEVTAPHAPRCSERLTKIGRKGEREREESAFGIAAAALPMSYCFGIAKYKEKTKKNH